MAAGRRRLRLQAGVIAAGAILLLTGCTGERHFTPPPEVAEAVESGYVDPLAEAICHGTYTDAEYVAAIVIDAWYARATSTVIDGLPAPDLEEVAVCVQEPDPQTGLPPGYRYFAVWVTQARHSLGSGLYGIWWWSQSGVSLRSPS